MKTRSTVVIGTATALALTLAAGCGSANAVADDGAGDRAGSRVERALEKLVADGDLIGGEATLSDRGHHRQVTAGVGDLESGTEYPEDAHFRIASVTKAFTSSLVLQLVADGEVGLDTSIETYLPGLLRGENVDAERITIRHLLRHQSGLPDIGDATEPQDPSKTYTPEELVALALENPGRFEPGEKMVYTNTNHIVAGMLIEKVTGESFQERLRERFTGPLDLDSTYLPERGDTSLRRPHPRGYHTGDGEPRDVTESETSGPWTSGGMVSTGADLNRFFKALARGKVVPAEQLGQMRDTVPMTGVPGVEYGLGLMRLPVGCELEVWGQAGDVPGFQTMVASTAGGKRAVTLAMNQSPHEDLGPAQLLTLLDKALC